MLQYQPGRYIMLTDEDSEQKMFLLDISITDFFSPNVLME